MLTDNQTLLLVVGLIYLWECCVWIPRDAVAVVTGLSPATLRKPSRTAGNSRGGFIMGQLLPGSCTFLCQPWPVSLSVDGFAIGAAADRPRGSIRSRIYCWAAVEALDREGTTLLVNGRHFCRTVAPSQTLLLQKALEKMRVASSRERQQEISTLLGQLFDTDAARTKLHSFRRQSTGLNLLEWLLFVLALICVPLATSFLGLAGALNLLGIPLLLLLLALVTLVFRIHRRLEPEAGSARFQLVVMMMLLPPMALRASDMLSRQLLAAYHPLVVGRLLLAPHRLQEFASEVVRELEYRPASETPPPAAAISCSWRHELVGAVREWLAAEEVDVIRAPNERQDGATAYCPRCLEQFERADAVCNDCAGLGLVLFEKI